MSRVRLGAVDYLNARPLVHGLQQSPRFDLRFDPPSKCAELLHAGEIDVGMIPAIEYCRGPFDSLRSLTASPGYRIVPGMAIASDGPVASVALFSNKPVDAVRTVAADTSSRTSNALVRILCAERFRIAPEFTPRPPDPEGMLREFDAALIIGDPALYLDHEALGVSKIDLGAEWTAMTGLPFVWAFWAGRPGVLDGDDVAALAAARDAGVAASDEIATAYGGPERAAQGRAYLRENIQYALGAREEAGLRRYYELAAKHGLIEGVREPLFY